MSVYHSFHAVGEEIAALQRRRAEAEKSGEAKRDEAGELRRQTEAMADGAIAAAQQRDEWNARIQQLDSAAAESDSSEGPPGTGTETASSSSTSAAALGLPAPLRLQQLRASIREAREEFQRSSLEFRRESGRARLQAAALGLDAGNLCALAYLSGRGAGNEGGGNDDDKDGLAAALDTLAEMLDGRHRRDRVLDDDDLDQDPARWRGLDLQDESVHELWHTYLQSKERCEAAERERDEADGILQEARRQVEARRQRLEPLRSQLDRVSNENRQLRARIDGLRGPSTAGRRGPGEEEGASRVATTAPFGFFSLLPLTRALFLERRSLPGGFAPAPAIQEAPDRAGRRPFAAGRPRSSSRPGGGEPVREEAGARAAGPSGAAAAPPPRSAVRRGWTAAVRVRPGGCCVAVDVVAAGGVPPPLGSLLRRVPAPPPGPAAVRVRLCGAGRDDAGRVVVA
jgi:uncharacterized coiled-coil DUF342 family protein